MAQAKFISEKAPQQIYIADKIFKGMSMKRNYIK